MAQLFSCEFCEISKNTLFTEHLRTTASIFYKILFWQVLTSLKICLECTRPQTFPGTVRSATYLKKDSTTNPCIPKPTS